MSRRNNLTRRRWLTVGLIGVAALIGSLMPAFAGGTWTRIDSAELERVRGSNILRGTQSYTCDSKNRNNTCAAAGGQCVTCSGGNYTDTNGQPGNQASGTGNAQKCGNNTLGECAQSPVLPKVFFCDTTQNGTIVGQCQPPPNSPGAQAVPTPPTTSN